MYSPEVDDQHSDLLSLGYPFITVDGKAVQSHRVAYRELVGPIPEGKQVLHRCGNALCVRPDHLYLGDHADNTSDAKRLGEYKSGPAHYKSLLTEQEVRDVRAASRLGVPGSEIARRLGVKSSVVTDILQGRTYNSVH